MATLAAAPLPDSSVSLATGPTTTMTKKVDDAGGNAEKPPIKRDEKPPDGAKDGETDADAAKKNQAREIK